MVSFGVVKWDGEGKILVAIFKRVGANLGTEMAEARAALYGPELARWLGYERVVLEFDSLNVVRAIAETRERCCTYFLFLRRLGFGPRAIARACPPE